MSTIDQRRRIEFAAVALRQVQIAAATDCYRLASSIEGWRALELVVRRLRMRVALAMQRPVARQIGIVLYVEWVLLYTLWAFYAHTSNVWQKAGAAWQACSGSISSQAASLQCDRIAEEIRRGVDYQAYLVEPFFRSLISGAIAALLVFALSRLVRKTSDPVE